MILLSGFNKNLHWHGSREVKNNFEVVWHGDLNSDKKFSLTPRN